MFFYRQGEFTDEKDREHLQVQEVGDEYQKGLALCVLSSIFIIAGVIVFIVYGVYINMGSYDQHIASSLRTGGKFKLRCICDLNGGLCRAMYVTFAV